MSETTMMLRVLTLNVWSDRRHPERTALLRDGIRDLDPDLVCLQEVEQSTAHDDLEMIVPTSGLHWYHTSRYLPGLKLGTAVGTRWEPREVMAQHLPSIQAGPSLMGAIVPLPIGVDLLLLGAKPSSKFTHEAQRCAQARAITWLEEQLRQPAPTIIAGDFDAAPENDCMRYFTGRTALEGHSVHFRDAWELAGDGSAGYTWTTDNRWVAEFSPSGWIQIPHRRRIDYVLAGSPESHPHVLSAITNCRVVLNGEPAPSDHYGVLAEIRLQLRARPPSARE